MTAFSKIKRRLTRDGFSQLGSQITINGARHYTYTRFNGDDPLNRKSYSNITIVENIDGSVTVDGSIGTLGCITSGADIKELSIYLNRIKDYADSLMKRYN